MSANEKDQNDNDLCKKHSTRCDKDYYRSACPAKLSKRELEDLYYSLLESNLELKRTVNAQNEKNTILSTKVQRMTALSKTYGGKACCAAGRAVINEQKAAIADLTKVNEALADRVRRLNTQLCTARQFLKQNPNARHCYKCYVNTTTSMKNLSTTSLHNRTSDANLKAGAASAILLDRAPPLTSRSTETKSPENEVESDEKGDAEKLCNENKCRSTMEDLKQKIEDLEEELVKTHTEYASRMSLLENQVSALQAGAVRARSDQELRARNETMELAQELRDTAAHKAKLETQLSMEKKKVSELEMRLKSAELSQQVARTIEEHLATANLLEEKQRRQSQTSVGRCSVCSTWAPDDGSPRPTPTKTTPKRPNELTVPDDKLSKSDDSGYADHRHESGEDDKNINKVNQELLKRIAEMQAQLDTLKLKSAENHNAEPDVYAKTLTPYIKVSDKDKENLLEHPRISIFEPGHRPTKDLTELHANKGQTHLRDQFPKDNNGLVKGDNDSNVIRKSITGNDTPDGINEANMVSSKYCECKRRNLESDGMDIDVRNEKHKLDDSFKENTVETNASIHRDCDNECPECTNHDCTNVNKEGDFNLNLQKQSRERFLGNSLEDQVDVMKTSPEKDINEESDIKPEWDSQVKHESVRADGELDEIKPETKYGDIKKESNTKRPSINNTPKSSITKTDDHIIHQIPGPLPVHSDSVASKRNVQSNKTASQNWKKAKNYGKKKTKGVVEDKNKIVEIDQTDGVTKEGSYDSAVKKYQNKKNSNGKNVANGDDLTGTFNDNNVNKNRKNKGLFKGLKHLKAKKIEYQDTLNDSAIRPKENPMGENFNEITTPNVLQSNVMNGYDDAKDQNETREYGEKTFQLDDTSKIRKTGTFEAFGSVLNDPPIGSSTPKAEQSTPKAGHRQTSPPRTYTVSEFSRAASPDNTDHEISGMTDLPTEKDGITPRDLLSPGEHKTTSTSTEIYSVNEFTLSEGEVPTGKYSQRRSSKSVGEAQTMDYAKQSNSIGERRSSENMEEALQAVSRELARCRALLRRPRPSDVTTP